MTDKKPKTVLNGFSEIVNESKYKPNKLWADQGRELCSKLMWKLLDNSDVLMYWTHNEGKYVNAGRFIRTLKGKMYK